VPGAATTGPPLRTPAVAAPDPADPSVPDAPDVPLDPGEPSDEPPGELPGELLPAEPLDPDEPMPPAEPAEPAEPEDPDEPEEPDEPDEPPPPDGPPAPEDPPGPDVASDPPPAVPPALLGELPAPALLPDATGRVTTQVAAVQSAGGAALTTATPLPGTGATTSGGPPARQASDGTALANPVRSPMGAPVAGGAPAHGSSATAAPS
jgi:hypothetical protein